MAPSPSREPVVPSEPMPSTSATAARAGPRALGAGLLPVPGRLRADLHVRAGGHSARQVLQGGRREAETRAAAPVSGRAYNGRAKTSRFTGVSWHDSYSKWKAQIYVRGSTVGLGLFEVEEDAARNYDAAVVEYELSGRTLNFPGEAPRADVLDALPPPPTRGVASRQIERERRPPRARRARHDLPRWRHGHKGPNNRNR